MRRAVWLFVGSIVAACTPATRDPSSAAAPPDASAAPATQADNASSPDGSRPDASLSDAGASHSAASDAGDDAADAGKVGWLMPLQLDGPEKTLAALCGPACRVVRVLPSVAPFKRVALAVGPDLDGRRTGKIQTTQVVFQANDGWYGAPIVRVGKGYEDVEMINPPGLGMEPFGHMNRPVTYGGRVERVRPLIDAATHARLVAIELTRTDWSDLYVLILCGVGADGHPACGELRTEPSYRPKGYTVDDGLVTVAWKDGTYERMQVLLHDR